MPRPPRTPAGRVAPLMHDLQTLRKGHGLTRTKVARARALCGLPVVASEAERLARPAEEVAYHLLIATVLHLDKPQPRGRHH